MKDIAKELRDFREGLENHFKTAQEKLEASAKTKEDYKEYWFSILGRPPAHRGNLNDMEWNAAQPKHPAIYKKGDFVEFQEGGFGRIEEVSRRIPATYSCREIPGKPFHKRNICAWHYEGDIKRKIGETIIKEVFFDVEDEPITTK